MEKNTILYVLTNESYGSVVAVSSDMSIIEGVVKDKLEEYGHLSQREIEEMIDESEYGDYFSVDSGAFLG